MRAQLHIVSSCTERKRQTPLTELRLRTVHGSALDSRASEWLARLRGASGTLSAKDLYVGDHWAVSRSLPMVAANAGFSAELWIASAGYGLVHSTRPLASYSATFAPGQPDSVSSEVSATARHRETRRWWDLVSALLRTPGHPRSIAAIAKDDPSARIIMLGSPEYVAALADDLIEARAHLNDPRRLLVVTSHHDVVPQLESNVVEVSARMRTRLGGAVGSLHARVARWLLERGDAASLDAPLASAKVAGMAARSPELPTLTRSKMSDREVTSFIRNALREKPRPACSGLLRRLRESGNACEQKRFRAIYRSIEED